MEVARAIKAGEVVDELCGKAEQRGHEALQASLCRVRSAGDNKVEQYIETAKIKPFTENLWKRFVAYVQPVAQTEDGTFFADLDDLEQQLHILSQFGGWQTDFQEILDRVKKADHYEIQPNLSAMTFFDVQGNREDLPLLELSNEQIIAFWEKVAPLLKAMGDRVRETEKSHEEDSQASEEALREISKKVDNVMGNFTRFVMDENYDPEKAREALQFHVDLMRRKSSQELIAGMRTAGLISANFPEALLEELTEAGGPLYEAGRLMGGMRFSDDPEESVDPDSIDSERASELHQQFADTIRNFYGLPAGMSLDQENENITEEERATISRLQLFFGFGP